LLALRVNALLKREKPTEAVKTVERFAAWAEKLDQKLRDGERYNAACCFALCAAANPGFRRAAVLKPAVNKLACYTAG